MQVTVAGYILLPLSLLFLFRPAKLLQLALVVSAFQAAAAVTFPMGGEPFGLSLSLIPGLMAAGMLGLDYATGTLREGERQAARLLLPMVLFALWALAGSYILPRLFAGDFKVWSQNWALGRVWLAPSTGNLTQGLYLAANTVAMVLVAFYASRSGTRHRVFLHAYLIAGYLAAGLALWQFVSHRSGLYFPGEFLYSNPRWAILPNQTYGDVNRINGSFAEPAALAMYLSGVVFACLRLDGANYRGFPVRPLLLLSLLALFLSTSTTGFIVVAIAVPVILFRMRRVQRQRLALQTVAAAATIIMIGVGAYLALPKSFDKVESGVAEALSGALVDKASSGSYTQRTTIDTDTIGVVMPSFGLGAGWGSVRSSSLFPGILGAAGIPGLVLLLWFGKRVARLLSQIRVAGSADEGRMVLDALAASLFGTIAAALLSGPTINDIEFFIRLAVVVGCAVRMRLDAAARNVAPSEASARSRPAFANALPRAP